MENREAIKSVVFGAAMGAALVIAGFNILDWQFWLLALVALTGRLATI